MKKILVIWHRHYPEPDAGVVHLRNRGCEIQHCRPFAGDELPDPGTVDGVVLTGGPQMVTEREQAPYLDAEMEFAMRVIDAETPLLAICLGAQMVACRLGAKVDWHPQGAVAFGFHEIYPTSVADSLFPYDFKVLSGNAQGFEIPPGAELLASGTNWPNQAYRIDRHLLAFQFHPEVTRGILNNWHEVMAHYVGRPGAQDISEQNKAFERHDPALKKWYRSILDKFFDLDGAG